MENRKVRQYWQRLKEQMIRDMPMLIARDKNIGTQFTKDRLESAQKRLDEAERELKILDDRLLEVKK